MIAEGSSSSSQTPMPRGGSAPGPSERDPLAERRARRLVESGEGALIRRAEIAEATVHSLEGHVAALQRRLAEAEADGQRAGALAARVESVERALATIRESHRRMAGTVGELHALADRLRVSLQERPAEAPARPRSDEMAEALAAAVERLRARAQESQPAPPASPARPSVAPQRPSHRHSLSLIGRWRMRRKQRREGR